MSAYLPLLAADVARPTATLGTVDWLVIAGYFGILIAVAAWVVRRRKDTTADYFLAGRNLGWWIIGASIFASNIGSEHVVGLAGTGCTDGVAMAHYELHAWCLLFLAWVFVPFYMRSKVFTMPEFLEKRFSVSSRYTLSVVSLITFIVSKIAVGIYAGGIVFSTLLPELHVTIAGYDFNSFWIGTVLVIVLTGLYTGLGGMRAVAYNDAIQVCILICGSGLLTLYGLGKLGGWGVLKDICGEEMLNLWKPLTPAGVESTWEPVLTAQRQAWYFNTNYPWLGMLFCAPIIGLWYWCTDQYIVQRALGAPDERTARRGSIFASFLKLLPPYLFIIPGLICFALAKQASTPEGAALHAQLFQGDVLQADQCQRTFPLMVINLLPVGLRGIVVAGLLSALMGSLAGVFNACSTLFTVDLYTKIRPKATEHQLVRVGRLATAVMVVISIAWIPVIQNAKGLYDYLQQVQGYLAPPIFIVFFFGVFWKRLNAKGCLWAMIVGFVIGIFRMLVDTPVNLRMFGTTPGGKPIGYADGSFLWIINHINFQYFSVLIAIVSAVVMVVVSYGTREPEYGRIGSLTFSTATAEDRRKSRESWDWKDIAGTGVILLVIAAAYSYFSNDVTFTRAAEVAGALAVVIFGSIGVRDYLRKREAAAEKEMMR